MKHILEYNKFMGFVDNIETLSDSEFLQILLQPINDFKYLDKNELTNILRRALILECENGGIFKNCSNVANRAYVDIKVNNSISFTYYRAFNLENNVKYYTNIDPEDNYQPEYYEPYLTLIEEVVKITYDINTESVKIIANVLGTDQDAEDGEEDQHLMYNKILNDVKLNSFYDIVHIMIEYVEKYKRVYKVYGDFEEF